jgi:hypothetical protein
MDGRGCVVPTEGPEVNRMTIGAETETEAE